MLNEDLQQACAAVADALKFLITAVQNNGNPAATSNARRARCEIDSGPVTHPAITQVDPQPNDAAGDHVPNKCLLVYMAGARGPATLARLHGPAIMASLGLSGDPYIVKCGTTTVPLETRLQQIGMDRYGAAVRTGGDLLIEPGFERWMAQTIMPSRQPRDPAVTLLPRAIAVDPPASLSRRQFDMALHEALGSRALDGLPPSVMPKRYVAYNLGATRVSEAREFYALSPHVQGDCDLLLDAVEGVLQQHRDRELHNPQTCARPARTLRPSGARPIGRRRVKDAGELTVHSRTKGRRRTRA